MPTIQAPDPPTPSVYAKRPGLEPIPGYVLIEPLGRGGFGEVWKCEAPGGLHKAVKFVAGSDDTRASGDAQLRQEFEAFQQVKSIRHPYLLCLERVEMVGNELVMVMGLADRQLGDRFHECQQEGLPGIPREELLGYLEEAAEALDVIGTKYGLQHLDVKPANLFLTAGHVQVGDYGLVSKLDGGSGSGKNRGLTPKYAAPEVLRGQVHTRSDQYSLALVYQELLTGTFPYSGRNPQQIMLQHVSGVPDLRGLPERDRGAVATALAKNPGDRFPSCGAFIEALVKIQDVTPPPKKIALGETKPATIDAGPHTRITLRTPSPSSVISPDRRRADADVTTHRNSLTATASVQAEPRRVVENEHPSLPLLPETAKPPPGSRTAAVQLTKILSVVPVEWLRGREAADPDLPPTDMVRAVLAATPRGFALPEPGQVHSLPDGNLACRFVTAIDPRVAKVKLNFLLERGGLTMSSRDERRVVFRQFAPIPSASGLFSLFGKKPLPPVPAGIEVVVELPEPGCSDGEVFAHGRVFGAPPPEFTLNSDGVIRTLLNDVRSQLGTSQERRKHPRFLADFPILLFPLHDEGRVDIPSNGRCLDVSAGGLAFRAMSQPLTRHVYLTFEGVRGVTGLAILLQIVRADRQEDGFLVSGRYRLDRWPPK